ncbi:MAG: hypothetical protein GC202_13970 [Alphaproteobacteria bacterium]|nr:hypothetical protein [Alphaproteobacteria bacterium]
MVSWTTPRSSRSLRRPWVLVTRRSFIAGGIASICAVPPAVAGSPGEKLAFADLYKSFGVLGYEFGDRARELAGRPVVMRGYMAPPLKAESNFFVLTRQPMALCPFCQSDADWPVDIVVVYLKRTQPVYDPSRRIDVAGMLELGSWLDPETGFVSAIRLRESELRAA